MAGGSIFHLDRIGSVRNGLPVLLFFMERVLVVEQAEPEDILRQAIAKKVCVTAVYNRAAVLLAPESLFTRHDALHLRAVTLEHDGRKPREARLGTFKVSGLGEVTLTRKLFSAKSVFGPLLEPVGES